MGCAPTKSNGRGVHDTRFVKPAYIWKTIDAKTPFLDKYELGEVVMPVCNRFTEVRFARRKSDGREVVVKLKFKPKCFYDAREEREFRRAVLAVLNLPSHPGILPISEVIEDKDACYVIMDRAKGADLQETLKRLPQNPPGSSYLSAAVATEAARQLLEAVNHLYSHGITHTDLKLENIMIDPDALHTWKKGFDGGQMVKLIDFDEIQVEGLGMERVAEVIKGTDGYIAPEAYAGQYTVLSDVFSIGVIVYKLLTRRLPFDDAIFANGICENTVSCKDIQEIQRKLMKVKIEWSYAVFKKNPGLQDLCQKLLKYNPQQRPLPREALQHPCFAGSGNSAVPEISSVDMSLRHVTGKSWLLRT